MCGCCFFVKMKNKKLYMHIMILKRWFYAQNDTICKNLPEIQANRSF